MPVIVSTVPTMILSKPTALRVGPQNKGRIKTTINPVSAFDMSSDEGMDEVELVLEPC